MNVRLVGCIIIIINVIAISIWHYYFAYSNDINIKNYHFFYTDFNPSSYPWFFFKLICIHECATALFVF